MSREGIRTELRFRIWKQRRGGTDDRDRRSRRSRRPRLSVRVRRLAGLLDPRKTGPFPTYVPLRTRQGLRRPLLLSLEELMTGLEIIHVLIAPICPE